jgi:hypothetical protein
MNGREWTTHGGMCIKDAWNGRPWTSGPLVRLHGPSVHWPMVHWSVSIRICRPYKRIRRPYKRIRRPYTRRAYAPFLPILKPMSDTMPDMAADAGQTWPRMRYRHGRGCGAYAGCLYCGRTQSFTRKVAGALATVHSPPCTRHRALATVHSSPCTSLASAAPGPGGGRRGRLYMCGWGAVREPLYHVARRCGSRCCRGQASLGRLGPPTSPTTHDPPTVWVGHRLCVCHRHCVCH